MKRSERVSAWAAIAESVRGLCYTDRLLILSSAAKGLGFDLTLAEGQFYIRARRGWRPIGKPLAISDGGIDRV